MSRNAKTLFVDTKAYRRIHALAEATGTSPETITCEALSAWWDFVGKDALDEAKGRAKPLPKPLGVRINMPAKGKLLEFASAPRPVTAGAI